MKYDVIIGLEIHAELKTQSKAFCSCQNLLEEAAPNTAVCPICLGHPGTLPVPNQRAIELAVLVGLALNCQINRWSKFDRKNYFYPDLPKGYQISQYDLPFAYHGELYFDNDHVEITRIHLEEDTGKSYHPQGANHTLLDFNRAGAPLLELVTEPTIKNAAAAKKFCQNYRLILRYLNASNADMEKGEMRCEANISLQRKGAWRYENGQIVANKNCQLNNKVEVKNINSFKSLERAIDFEIIRQTNLLDNGEKVIAETRGWDDNKNETISQRNKENAADYRYFPEPDIPPIVIDDEWLEKITNELVELPENKKNRFCREYGLKAEIAGQLTDNRLLANFSEEVFSELGAWIQANGDSFERQDKKLAITAAGWITSELAKNMNANNGQMEDLQITPENFAELICLIYRGKITSNAGQEILSRMYNEGGDPENIMKELGLEQINDQGELEETVKKILAQFPEQTAQYKNGKTPLLQFFLGKVMAESAGKANPAIVKELLEKMLSE